MLAKHSDVIRDVHVRLGRSEPSTQGKDDEVVLRIVYIEISQFAIERHVH